MSRLEDLLALPDVSEVTEEVHINEKLGTFTVKPLTEQQLQDYRVRCRKGKKDADIDGNKLNCLIIANHVVDPNLKDADFLSRAGCATAAEFINKKFKAGVTSKICNAILEASEIGDIAEEIEAAKN